MPEFVVGVCNINLCTSSLTKKLKAIYGPCLISFHGSPEDREDVGPSFSLGTDWKKLPGVLGYKKRVVQG